MKRLEYDATSLTRSCGAHTVASISLIGAWGTARDASEGRMLEGGSLEKTSNGDRKIRKVYLVHLAMVQRHR